MPCHRVEMPGGGVAFIRAGKPRRPKCGFCRKQSAKLCDAVVGKTLAGEELTCDAPICLDCTVTHPNNPNKDLCPKHGVTR